MRSLAKRGDIQTSFLIKLITVLTLGIMLFVLIKNTSQTGINIAEKSTCKESVEQYHQLKELGNYKLAYIVGGGNLASSGSIKCPVELKTINPSDAERAKKQLADAMFDCFDEFGAGQYDLFDTNRETTNHYCIVCSKITFTKKDEKIAGFADYLSDNTAPGKKMTYFQYFKGDSVDEGEAQTVNKCVKTSEGLECEATPEALKNAPFDNIDTSAEHAILFTYSKSTGWWDAEVAGVLGIAVGGAVGFFTGGVGWVLVGTTITGGGIGIVAAPTLQSDWQAGVILLPYNQNVRDYLKCDEVPIKQ